MHDNYIVNEDASITLNNWMVNLDLVCAPKYEIGMMGVLLFVG